MLKSFRIKNFKAFQDTFTVDLPSLTLLAGVNSAGKSSLIQALLLLKQTLESGPAQALNPAKETLLNQSLGDNFNDFVFDRPPLERVALTYDLAFVYEHEEEEGIFDAYDTLAKDVETLDKSCQSLLSKVLITFKWGSFGHRGRPTIRVADLQISISTAGQPIVGLRIQPSGSGAIYKVQPIVDDTHPALRELDFAQLEVDGLSNFLPDSLIITPREQLQLFSETPVPASFARLFRALFAAIRRDLSERIYYLNSFREPPSRWYSSGKTSKVTLDPDGNNFAEVLWHRREEMVRYGHADGHITEDPLPIRLRKVLLNTLRLEQYVQVQPVGEREDILEIKVDTLGSKPLQVTLADVGLGYNQVLPVVVQGLLTPPGALVIFEQPEIHLHPDVQARLIHFFAGLARAGRKVLVETHSSHMIDSLCLAIVKDRSNWLAENTKVLFVHPPDEDNPGARIEQVRIDPYGQICNYPPHFLPDVAALYEEILKERFAKKREEKGKQETAE